MTRPPQPLTGVLPRVRLAHLPTPLEHAQRLSQAVGGPPIWVKREDLSGLALGGNKARQLEFLMAALQAEGAQALVTTAAAQSNFCRSCAAAGARLGIRVGLLLRGSGAEEVQGNLLLDTLFGAEVRFIPTQDPYDARVPGWLEAFAADFEARGLKAHVLHMPGRTATLGAAAMVDAGDEMVAQFRRDGIEPQAVFTAGGSGLSAAGLALAFKAHGLRTRVVCMSVQRDAAFMAPLLAQRANEAAVLLGLPQRFKTGDIEVDDAPAVSGYGVPTRDGLDAILLAGRSEGWVCDPVYTGKALAAMLAQIRAGRWKGQAPVVFFHSGGAPGLFAAASQLAALLPREAPEAVAAAASTAAA